uniref:VWFD domain-containing protein n=1 Tax=Petromyzon marinus TaxID=7757 RepID=S4RHP3_PETMA
TTPGPVQTTAGPAQTTAAEQTTAGAVTTTAATTAGPVQTTSGQLQTTAGPVQTTAGVVTTTAATTAGPVETTAGPLQTTPGAITTTAATTAGLVETTAGPVQTTPGAITTTAATTAGLVETTAGPVQTTAAEQTTPGAVITTAATTAGPVETTSDNCQSSADYSWCSHYNCSNNSRTSPNNSRPSADTTPGPVQTTAGPAQTTAAEQTTAGAVTTTAATTAGPVQTTSAPPTAPPNDCHQLNPPRKLGEQWNENDCMLATCMGDGSQVSMTKRPCVVPSPPACESGRPSRRVTDPDGCCYHWECDCICTGFGDTHMQTFDGARFSPPGNCTYILVEERQKLHDFSIVADNFDCASTPQASSCTRGLVISYQGNVLRATMTSSGNPSERRFLLNQKTKKAPFNERGFQVSTVKTDDIIFIKDLRVRVQFNGLGFLIDLPRDLFWDNTQGQCGTCNNMRKDDCMGRDGIPRAAECCAVAAGDWMTDDPAKPQCIRMLLPAKLSCAGGATQATTCAGADECNALILQTFQSCSAVVDLSGYYEGCKSDHCKPRTQALDCAGAQLAAAECGRAGVCVNWRPLVPDKCPYTCPGNMVYKYCETKATPVC